MRTAAAKAQDEWAERIVLSGLMKEPEEVLVACRKANLGATDFYQDIHQKCFLELVYLWNANQELGPLSLYMAFKKRNSLNHLGKSPAVWIARVWEADPTGWWACSWAARRVKELSIRRQVIYRANIIVRDARDGVREPGFYSRVLNTFMGKANGTGFTEGEI